MDGRLYHEFVESLLNVLDFKCNSLLSVKLDVTFAQGIMVFWNIMNACMLMIKTHEPGPGRAQGWRIPPGGKSSRGLGDALSFTVNTRTCG